MPAIIVLDANVLIPNALCDLLLRLAEEDLYVPRWSAEILDEVRRNVPGVSPAAIERRIVFMNTAFDTAMITGYGTPGPRDDQSGQGPACACGRCRVRG